jgi:hypothetical protein
MPRSTIRRLLDLAALGLLSAVFCPLSSILPLLRSRHRRRTDRGRIQFKRRIAGAHIATACFPSLAGIRPVTPIFPQSQGSVNQKTPERHAAVLLARQAGAASPLGRRSLQTSQRRWGMPLSRLIPNQTALDHGRAFR